MKENGFTLAKARSSRYSAQTITDVDDADEIALLANTTAQAESLLHSLEIKRHTCAVIKIKKETSPC